MEKIRHAEYTETRSVFRVIEILTGIKLREGLKMEYALSLIMQSQPQINLLGKNSDRVSRKQILMVAEGVSQAGEHMWKNLNPNYVDFITPYLEAKKRAKR